MNHCITKYILMGAAIVTMSACQRDAGDFLHTVNAKYPLKPGCVAISHVLLDGNATDPANPLTVKPNTQIRLAADIADGKWSLGNMLEFTDGTAAAPTVANARPKPKESDRTMSFIAFVRTPADMANPMHKEPEIMFFRFKPDGLGAELSATLTAPKTHGKYTIDVYCVDSSGKSLSADEAINPIFRCLIDVRE